MTRVLILRLEPGASATVRTARAMGLDAVAVPLFKIEPVTWSAPDVAGFDGLLLTSANAVRCGGEQLSSLRGIKAYTVGEATADAARQAGFDIAAVGDAGIDRLLDLIDPNLRLLHLCAGDRREPERPRQAIVALPVYRAEEIEHPDLKSAPGSVALLHSPRAGRRFADLVADRGSIVIAAISQATADAAGDGWRRISVADQPGEQALLALAASLCNKPHPQ